MNLQQLEYIAAVDRLKNFSKAAESCYVTQATLSAMVKKLEEELDITIFDRKNNPILTTECGKEIIAEAKKVLYHTNQLTEIAKNAKNKIEGDIRIGVIPTIANSLLPKILKSIIDAYPKLNLNIIELTTENIVSLLKKGEIDTGILATPLNDKEIEEDVLYYETLMVYGNVDNQKQYILPDELNNYKIWLLEEGHCLREQTIKFCHLKESNTLPQNLNFEANSLDTLLNMVDEFGGLTLIPELFYQQLPEHKRKKVSFFKAPIPVREVSMVYYHPYAKYRIINALTEKITTIINGTLLSEKHKKHELSIVQF